MADTMKQELSKTDNQETGIELDQERKTRIELDQHHVTRIQIRLNTLYLYRQNRHASKLIRNQTLVENIR